ncbi:MAG: peptidase prolyl oligopeptidase, partial [Verrucomicrobiales bacterium]|nr:peptidase prolyl oligopeptidase [Verrucomicrobiales bacterium]
MDFHAFRNGQQQSMKNSTEMRRSAVACVAINQQRSTFALIIYLFLFVGTSGAIAELPRLIPRALLFGNPEYISPLISPDGTHIAYLKADTNAVVQIWARDLAGTEEKQISHELRRGISWWTDAHAWAYNGQLLFLKDTDGDEMEHLFVCDVKTCKVSDLTPFPGIKASLVGCEPTKPDEVLITLNHKGKTVFDLWSVNLSTGALLPVMENPGDVI